MKVDNLFLLQMSFFSTKCAPFLLKIEEDFNINDLKGKRNWTNELFLITDLNTFGSKVFLHLEIMNVEKVILTKVVRVYVIEGMNV